MVSIMEIKILKVSTIEDGKTYTCESVTDYSEDVVIIGIYDNSNTPDTEQGIKKTIIATLEEIEALDSCLSVLLEQPTSNGYSDKRHGCVFTESIYRADYAGLHARVRRKKPNSLNYPETYQLDLDDRILERITRHDRQFNVSVSEWLTIKDLITYLG